MVPNKVRELVEKFELHKESYKSTSYNETQLRREFLDPLFEVLGWDLDNKQGYAEAYKDVIHEDAIKIGAYTKAPDYCFRIGGVRKFFVEAKKPFENIEDSKKHAFQLKRYAWSAKLPISILTDFEEFAIYDTRCKPFLSDSATKHRVAYYKYSDFIEKWDEISSVFSRESILKGAFDIFAEDTKSKKGTSEVDTEFLKEIERWRELLAKDLAKYNVNLLTRELNYSVQKTIDRIIFLRISEDRGIEDYGKLLALTNHSRVYQSLCEIFEEADQKYNSGLFHFKQEKDINESADTLTLKLNISDNILKEIIRDLYYPNSPYEFSVLPADTLGHVYEQFLGKVIRLTDEHTAVIEDKPEVKKAGGVYYTPTYIVDYIVKNTIGELVNGKTLKQVEKIKVLDPACGSGTFLLQAYQYLLDWHRDFYLSNITDKFYKGKNPVIFQIDTGDWRLTTSEKRRILLNNIFGVDIDAQAVEVTKLSLLLKVLEGESQQTLSKQLNLFHERALPDLGSNIKCGNSLIGQEIYNQLKLDFYDENSRYRINAFDWYSEFKVIMASGGFDAIIGNPPYIRIQAMKEWAPIEVEFYKKHYITASSGNYDIYVVFIERGLELLNKKGLLGYILPHKFFNAQYGEPTRKMLSENFNISRIVHFGDIQVFKNATTYTCLIFLNKKKSNKLEFERVTDLDSWISEDKTEKSVLNIPVSSEWNFVTGIKTELFNKLKALPSKLGMIADIFVGLQTSADKIYILKEIKRTDKYLELKDQQNAIWVLEKDILKPFINKVAISTYKRIIPNHWIIFPYILNNGSAELIDPETLASTYPNTWAYLRNKDAILKAREKGKWNNDQWYAFGRTQNLQQMDAPKLIVQVISKTGKYAFDESGIYFTGGGNGPYYGVRWLKSNKESLHYLQALLSSSLLDFYLRQVSSPFRGGYWSYGKRFIEQLPIKLINFSNSKEKSTHDRLVSLVIMDMDLNEQLQKLNIEHEKIMVERQIESIKHQINLLIYELYQIAEDEIKIVEAI